MIKDENPIYAPLAKWWFEHQQRRQYLDGVCFEPEGEVGPTRLNLWRGFTVAPKPGSGHQAWLGHVRDVICSGNVDHYNYLIRWCARLFQHPATQSEVAIVLKGREGTGKNTFVNAMAVLLGRHFFESADSSTFLGQFTAHLRDKVLVHANEAFYAGNKQHDGALKTLITEALVKIEAKGVDLTREPNYMHLIMSSNSEWVVPAGADARRYFVLDVADVRMQDTDYFAQVNALLHDRTAQANLLHFLLSMDLTDFNVRKMPVTSALLDQKAKSMASEFAWWNQCLTYGAVVSGDADWPSRVQCERVRDEYHRYCDGMKVNYGRKDMVELGKFLSKMGVSREQHRHEGGRASFYIFRPMEDHRDIFDKKAGGPFEWPKVEEKGQVEIPI